MIKAANETSDDIASKNAVVADKKKNLVEGQIDLVRQYLMEHRKDKLKKDKTLEIKLAQAMIESV